MNSGYGHYVLKETLISATVSGTLSGVVAWVVFGGLHEVSVWGHPGLAVDFIPQTFIASLLSVIVPTLITHVRSRSGVVAPTSHGMTWIPRNLILRAVLIAVVLTLLLGSSAIAVVSAYGAPMAIGFVYAMKVAYGALVALFATPFALIAHNFPAGGQSAASKSPT